MGIQDDEDSKDRQDAQYDHLEGLDEAQDPAVPYQKPKAIAKLKLYLIVAVLIALGTGNFLLLKIVYSAYPAKYSFFVNQGINLGYVVFGVCVVLPRIYWTKEVTPEMRKYPQRPFFYMGVLDSLGTFFTAMGTYGTPGAATPLLNQTLIPFTMLASLCILKDVSYHRFEILGAVIIMAGAVLSVMNQVLHPDSGSGDGSDHSTHWYCVLFYLASNVPMACSANYKERNFGEAYLDVWYLTQWVSTYQFFFSFLYIPFLCLPGFAGNTAAIPMQTVLDQLWDGCTCFLETNHECEGKNTMVLLLAYTAVNMMFNTLGLYLTQQASAVVCYITYALLLPITTLMFSAHFLGQYQESLSGFTFAGLAVVLIGFVVYQRYSYSVTDEEAAASVAGSFASEASVGSAQRSVQSSFQERVVGMGKAHRTRSHTRSMMRGDFDTGLKTDPMMGSSVHSV
eukprot:TRINITY_DN16966_c0_g1_i2.p1 TRINITY_DN16966_c0_g1~~TRINITY_DN16966_c0_g1_i2.p1  ORF type:complete len:453 (-),score=89.59 TRINITY_DN16966_c0_g1_i2:3-1361(-)